MLSPRHCARTHTHMHTQKWGEWNDDRDRLLLVARELARRESDVGEEGGGGRSQGAGAPCELSAGGEVGGGAGCVVAKVRGQPHQCERIDVAITHRHGPCAGVLRLHGASG